MICDVHAHEDTCAVNGVRLFQRSAGGGHVPRYVAGRWQKQNR